MRIRTGLTALLVPGVFVLGACGSQQVRCDDDENFNGNSCIEQDDDDDDEDDD